MLDALKRAVLRFARVPAEPQPPFGSTGSLRVFRAAPNYWKYLLVVWGLRQVVAAIALAAAFTFSWVSVEAVGQTDDVTLVTREGKVRRKLDHATLRRYADWIHVAEVAGLGFYLLQVPFSLAAARLGYEMRWYMVTDRSLRLREGIFGVREMTLTFANVQNITIRQGPLQRLLGIADVVVQTAGGGGGEAHGHPAHGQAESMHTGVLRAVDNAESVRDLILDRLRRLRDAGLGDPDDRHHASPVSIGGGAIALRAAAREVLEEIRALRSSLG